MIAAIDQCGSIRDHSWLFISRRKILAVVVRLFQQLGDVLVAVAVVERFK